MLPKKTQLTNHLLQETLWSKINLPIYYRNQLFTEEEKEALFLDKIEKGIIYVMGQKVHRDDEEYYLQRQPEGRKIQKSCCCTGCPLGTGWAQNRLKGKEHHTLWYLWQ